MDLSYGPEYDVFRDEVKSFLGDNWPLKGAEAKASFGDQVRTFTGRATRCSWCGSPGTTQ